jgi:hypothetical protein
METEQEKPESSYPMEMGGMSGHNTEGSLRFQLEFEDIVEHTILDLQCRKPRLDQNNNVIFVQDDDSTPLINNRGATRIRTILRSKLNRNAPLSDLDDTDIRKIARDVEINVHDTLFDHWNEFEIPSISAATTIVETIGDCVFINLRKSRHGVFLKHLRSTHQTHEQLGQQRGEISSESKGIIKRLFS